MSYDDDLKLLLNDIDEGQFDEASSLPSISRDKLINMLHDCEEQNFLSHKSSKQKLVTGFMGGGFMLDPSAFVTRKGRQFLEGKENASDFKNQFNINNVSGSNFGDHGTINNTYGSSISEIQALIAQITNTEDKQEGHELVTVLETKEPLKPGILKRFNTFLGNYSNIADSVGKFLLSIATGIFNK